MRLRLLVAALAVLAFAPPAQANDPPYPACSPATPFTWHVGAHAYATSLYVVQLHDAATEVWARVGATGTWMRSPARHEADGAFTTVRPLLGQGDLAVGFKSSNAGGACLALEEHSVAVRRRVPVTGLHPVARGGVLRASAFGAGHGCHSLGGGSFTWRFVTGGKRRFIRLGNGCGVLNGDGVPTRGARVRTTFFTVLTGTAAKRGAPPSYLVVRAAHPRRSGTARFNLTGVSADLPGCAGCPVTHTMSAVIGVTVTVEYRPGLQPTWRTSIRFGRKLKLGGGSPANTGAGGSSNGGGTVLGGGTGGSGDPSCSGDC